MRDVKYLVTYLFSISMTFATALVPESASGVAISKDKGYVVEEVKDGLYWVAEGAYTAMLFTVMHMLSILVV